MRFILDLVLMALAIMITAYIIPGVHIGGFWNALLAGFLISFVNTFVGGILRLLTFPINFLTFGLMSFVITVLMIMLVDSMMGSLSIDGFWVTALFAIVLAIVRSLINSLLNQRSN
jgi:putative membrane protein